MIATKTTKFTIKLKKQKSQNILCHIERKMYIMQPVQYKEKIGKSKMNKIFLFC